MRGDLNERQHAVLSWVSQGCPSGFWPDSTYKVSAQALRCRGLIKVTKRRGYWNAEITDKGRQYLADTRIGPRDHDAEAPEAPEDLATRRPQSKPKTRTNHTDQLLEELAANNNHLIKATESGPHAVNWASRISAARQSGKIPHTQELRGKHTYNGYEISLVDIPAWRLAEPTPIAVPVRLTRPHPVVTALQHPQRMGLTKSIHNRALRLIQALVTDAESKGYTTTLGPTPDTPPPRHRRQAAPHFTITAQAEYVDILVLQEQDHSKHIPTDKERADTEKNTWMRIPRFDYTPADRLRFILRGSTPHRGSEWADLDGRPLEDQLAEIAQEIDLRGEAAEQRRHADEQAQEAARQNRGKRPTQSPRRIHPRLSRPTPRKTDRRVARSQAPDRIRHSSTQPRRIPATRTGKNRDRGAARVRRRPPSAAHRNHLDTEAALASGTQLRGSCAVPRSSEALANRGLPQPPKTGSQRPPDRP